VKLPFLNDLWKYSPSSESLTSAFCYAFSHSDFSWELRKRLG
jgi:hypothetical protein